MHIERLTRLHIDGDPTAYAHPRKRAGEARHVALWRRLRDAPLDMG